MLRINLREIIDFYSNTNLTMRLFHEWVGLDRFSKITPETIKMIAEIRANETGSLKKIMPTIAVPAAPIPVHTA